MKRIVPTIMLRALLLGCATALWAAPVPQPPKDPDKDAEYFPTVVGDKWVYLVTSESGKVEKQEWTETVTAVKEKDGVKIVAIGHVYENGKVTVDREREVSAKGIVQTRDAILNVTYPSEWTHLKLPHKVGRTWDVPQLEETQTTQDIEQVEVPAGTYQAIRVEHRKQGDAKATVHRTDWYARRVGIVKIKDGDTLIVLKSFSRGKQ